MRLGLRCLYQLHLFITVSAGLPIARKIERRESGNYGIIQHMAGGTKCPFAEEGRLRRLRLKKKRMFNRRGNKSPKLENLPRGRQGFHRLEQHQSSPSKFGPARDGGRDDVRETKVRNLAVELVARDEFRSAVGVFKTLSTPATGRNAGHTCSTLTVQTEFLPPPSCSPLAATRDSWRSHRTPFPSNRRQACSNTAGPDAR